MPIGTILTDSSGQTVLLPEEARFPDSVRAVEVRIVGNDRILTPVGSDWDSWFNGEGVSEDFMAERDQP
jgi:antitoxin VapB